MNTAQRRRESAADIRRSFSPGKRLARFVVAAALVALAVAAGPLAGAPLTSAADPTGSAAPSASSTGGGPSTQPGLTSVSVAPASPQVAVGSSIDVNLRIATSVDVGRVLLNLTFDQTLLQVQKVDIGPLWSGAPPVRIGLGTNEAAIAQANTTGLLAQVSVAVPPGSGPKAVDGVFAVVTLKAIANGTSPIGLTGVNVLDPGDVAINGVGTTDSQVVVGAGAPASPEPGSGGAAGSAGGGSFSLPLPLVVELMLVLLVVLMLIGQSRRRRRLGGLMRKWPLALSLMLGLIPVAMFFAIVAIVVMNSLPAWTDPGLGALLGDHFVGIYSANGSQPVYGLLPALVGTFLIAGIAMLLAVPVSLAMAIVSTEFPMGPVGRVVRPIVGLLSGIPPIVYAVSVVLFVQGFMIPKFAADSAFSTFDPSKVGANPATWPPADVPFTAGSYPWIIGGGGGNSALLGGILIAMLLIPFMTPMIVDAIRNVPSSSREASLALGANRGYTLRKAILPMAMPGIATAATLGTLKAIGDIVIVSFAVGWTADSIPNPIFDVLERTPGLAAHGANMITPFTLPGQGGLPTSTAVGYVSALVLLLAAGAMVLLITILKARWRRRLSA